MLIDAGLARRAAKIREIRRAIVIFSLLSVLWWIVEFITYVGRTAPDAFDAAFVAILAVGGWLVFQAWLARCPRCDNPFFLNRGLPLGFHFSSECPYCGLSVNEPHEASD
jgi:hypothetical protein